MNSARERGSHVLVVRPWGLFGRQQAASRTAAPAETPLRPAGRLQQRIAFGLLVAIPAVLVLGLAGALLVLGLVHAVMALKWI